MFTHKDYLDGKCSHDEYYAQLVEGSNAKAVVLSHFTLDELRDMFAQDEHFNKAPDSKWFSHSIIGDKTHDLETWDVLGTQLHGVDYKKYGDGESLAGRVCVLKCAARMLIEKNLEPRNV